MIFIEDFHLSIHIDGLVKERRNSIVNAPELQSSNKWSISQPFLRSQLIKPCLQAKINQFWQKNPWTFVVQFAFYYNQYASNHIIV